MCYTSSLSKSLPRHMFPNTDLTVETTEKNDALSNVALQIFVTRSESLAR